MNYPDFNDHHGLSIPPMEKKKSGVLNADAREGLLKILERRVEFVDDVFMDNFGCTWIDQQAGTALTISEIGHDGYSHLTITGEGSDYSEHRELFDVFGTSKEDLEVTTAVVPQERETA